MIRLRPPPARPLPNVKKEEQVEKKESFYVGRKYCAVNNPKEKGFKGIIATSASDIIAIAKALESGREAPGVYTWYSLEQYEGYQYAVITKHDWYKLGYIQENEWGVESP